MAAPKMPSTKFELATIQVEKLNEALANEDLLEVSPSPQGKFTAQLWLT